MDEILIDGLSSIIKYKLEIFLLLFGIIAASAIAKKDDVFEGIEGATKYFAAISTGFIILTGITFFLSFLSIISHTIFQMGCYFIAVFAIFIVAKEALTKNLNIKEVAFGFVTVLLFVLLLAIRLPYLQKILLPGYTDSPIHYQIIQQILVPEDEIHSNLSIRNIFETYYHFGFHGLQHGYPQFWVRLLKKSCLCSGRYPLQLPLCRLLFSLTC